TELAQHLLTLDRGALDAAKTRGERAAAVAYAILQLPADQRATYAAQHQDLAADIGVPLDQVDWTNDAQIRATADGWLDASKMAGDVTLQRFGDNVQTVRTDRRGTEVLDNREIPVTRAEQLDRQQVEYRQQTDQRDFGYRQQRDQADDQYREKALEVRGTINSAGDVLGPILATVAQSGPETLSPGQREIYDRYIEGGQTGAGFGFGAPTPPPAGAAPAAAPARTPASRQSPQGADPFPGIAEGQIVVQDGVRYQRRGGQMVPQ
ncbi:MAG TPA: hypothetical protein VFF48_04525, partial [Brevundimonas sp.]|nr:hypothetical protein [Brevundimonas sp.]